MSKFKVGDRVRLTGKRWPSTGLLIGDIVTITREDAYGGGFQVNGDEWYIYDGYEAELVEDDTPTADAVSPAHYQFPGGAEVNDISQWLTSNAAQALQYIARSSRIDGKNKGDAREDISKAIKFLNFELNRLDIK